MFPKIFKGLINTPAELSEDNFCLREEDNFGKVLNLELMVPKTSIST